MLAWTPAERRGALLVAVLLALAAARDLWRANHPVLAPGPIVESADTASAPDASGIVARAAPALPVDLNRADATELDALPGIGPVLAGRILQYRAAHGPFRETEQLMAVPGIGPRLFERLRPHVCVRGMAEAPSPGAGSRPAPRVAATRDSPVTGARRRDPAIGNGGRAGRPPNPIQDSTRPRR
jgi:competence ComEA-like helix-hairpin-helix protein